MPEQDVKIGSVGSASLSEAIAGESASASVQLGPVKVQLVASIDNAALVALVASKLPGGVAHDIVVALQNALFPAPAAPSA